MSVAPVKWTVTSWHNIFTVCQSMLSTDSPQPPPHYLAVSLQPWYLAPLGRSGAHTRCQVRRAQFEGPASLCGARQGSAEEGPCVQLEGLT